LLPYLVLVSSALLLAAMKTIRVLHIEPNATEQKRVEQLLKPHKHLRLEKQYASPNHALYGLKHWKPDVLLLEAQLPDMSLPVLLETAFGILPGLHPVVFTQCNDIGLLYSALPSKASFLLKRLDDLLLPHALVRAQRDEVIISPCLANHICDSMCSAFYPAPELIALLTEGELRVAEGLKVTSNNKELSKLINIEVSTIGSHINSICKKLGASNAKDIVQLLYYQPLKSRI